jgi:hypothetical protein
MRPLALDMSQQTKGRANVHRLHIYSARLVKVSSNHMTSFQEHCYSASRILRKEETPVADLAQEQRDAV